MPIGETWLAASVLIGILALPTIISVSEEAVSSVPREYKEGSCYWYDTLADNP